MTFDEIDAARKDITVLDRAIKELHDDAIYNKTSIELNDARRRIHIYLEKIDKLSFDLGSIIAKKVAEIENKEKT